MNKSNSLLTVIATHNGDFGNASDLITWIGELDGKLPFPLLIVVDQTVAADRYTELFKRALEVFSHVRVLTVQVGATGHKPNKMFMVAAQYVKDNYALPFLWLEPDCVPMKRNWLADLNEAYHESPLRYMGAIISQEGQKGLPAKHLTGCSIYPNNAVDDFDAITNVTNGTTAWDIATGEKIVNAAQNTNLIHHFWGEPAKWPVFVESRKPDSPDNEVMVDFVRTDAVLFHRAKQGDLIPLLRKIRNAASVPGQVEIAEPIKDEDPISKPELIEQKPQPVSEPIIPALIPRRGRPPKQPAGNIAP
jgi:hypothetical protein